jgi:LemA protein
MVESILVVAGLLLLVVCFWIVTASNRFARLEALIRESWANVDVALKRRHDLIPNLVETVKAHAAHESEVLERVVAARNQAISGGPQDENELARSVSVLLARTEAYPNLRSSVSFLGLQQELVNTEDRIAAARRFYNANVRDYNTALESFPSNLLAGDRKPKEFYEIDSIDMRFSPQLDLQT